MAENPDLSQYRVLICGVDPLCRTVIDQGVDPNQITNVPNDLEKFAESAIMPNLVVLLFGNPPKGVSMMEVAQVARMRYPKLPIYYITSTRTDFDRKECQKNGFTDAYLIPIDSDIFLQNVREEISRATKGLVRSYRPVSLVDLRPNETLNFDTFMYMPVNKKHLLISHSGDAIDEKKFQKLNEHYVNAVHVSSDQMKDFYDYAANKLKVLQNGEGMSETERKDRMTNAIRGLMASVFNDNSSDATIDKGRSIVTDCQQIVKSFIVGTSKENAWYEKMLQITGAESGTYNHSGNVATFAALFSLAVGIGKPEDVALAGLLHDMGLADIPPALQAMDAARRNRQEEEAYRKHVEHTLAIIKFRKMIMPESVTKAIAQHHERWSGTGYPKGYAGERISKEAQIVALADEFDYRTMSREGRPRMKPAEAFKAIYEDNLNQPSTAQFDLELLRRFLAVFPEEK